MPRRPRERCHQGAEPPETVQQQLAASMALAAKLPDRFTLLQTFPTPALCGIFGAKIGDWCGGGVSMMIGRFCVAVLCLLTAVPALPQSPQTDAAQSHANQVSADVVVTGSTDQQKSNWRRAESQHLVVFSKGSEAELKRTVINLEQLYLLMSRLYRHGVTTDETVKLQVVLVDSAGALRAAKLSNLRSSEGPFAASFVDQRYYDPAESGALLIVPRSDETVEISTHRRMKFDCEAADMAGSSRASACARTSSLAPVVRRWQEILYGAFAQHFVLTYAPAAYPRWYLDGIGALFSTFDVRRDGKIDYSRPPLDLPDMYRSYGILQATDVVTGRYLDPGYARMDWTPYHAWLLTHYFVFGALKPERAKQFAQYMAAIGQGVPAGEAAKVFGKPRKLDTDLRIYANDLLSYARANPSQELDRDPLISQLSLAGGAAVEARIELQSRLTAPLPPGGSSDDGWIAAWRAKLGRVPVDNEATLMAAELNCRNGYAGECLVAAERVLATSPADARALAWKGQALVDQAIAGPPTVRAERLAAARATLQHAIQIDPGAPMPQIALFQSYTGAGEPAPVSAMAGMASAIRLVPAAPAPRLYLAQELVRQGHVDLARRLLNPVLFGGYDSPERTAASTLLASSAPNR